MRSTIRTLFALALVAIGLGACAAKPEYDNRDSWFAVYGPGGAGRD
jgi:hypothetical protein